MNVQNKILIVKSAWKADRGGVLVLVQNKDKHLLKQMLWLKSSILIFTYD